MKCTIQSPSYLVRNVHSYCFRLIGQSSLMLCAARLRHIAGSKWGQKRYLNMEPLKDQELERQMEVASV